MGVGAFVLVALISYGYLLPATEAAARASPEQRRVLNAYSAILLCLALLLILGGVVAGLRAIRWKRHMPAAPTRFKQRSGKDLWH